MGDIFPHAQCVVTPIDRLTHCAEVVKIEANSYQQPEAEERAASNAAVRAARRR